MVKAYNKKVRPSVFKEENLILKKILPISREDQRKWVSNYKEPYVVKITFFGEALNLTKMDEDDLPKFVSFDVVKKYYV